MQPDQEFITSVIIIGAILTGGLFVVTVLTFLGIAVYKKKKETKLTIHGKERQNGKATTRGKW
jgi:hypothetical protein